jgi:hypothetical protein
VKYLAGYNKELNPDHAELFGEAVRKMMCKSNLKHLEVEVQTIQLVKDSQVQTTQLIQDPSIGYPAGEGLPGADYPDGEGLPGTNCPAGKGPPGNRLSCW